MATKKSIRMVENAIRMYLRNGQLDLFDLYNRPSVAKQSAWEKFPYHKDTKLCTCINGNTSTFTVLTVYNDENGVLCADYDTAYSRYTVELQDIAYGLLWELGI